MAFSRRRVLYLLHGPPGGRCNSTGPGDTF
jgi:hypothetical protein